MERRSVLKSGIAIVILSLLTIASLCGAAVAPGDLDISFGIDGKVITDFGGQDVANALAIDSSGKIVVAGYSVRSGIGHDSFVLARYNTDGGLDTTFGTDGKVITEFIEFGEGDGAAYAYALAIDSSGKIVVAGYAGKYLPDWEYDDFALARYNADGSLDTTFGINGTVTIDFGGNEDRARALAIDSSGKIVVAGYAGNYNRSEHTHSALFALVRYNADGSLDTTFGINGMVTTDFGGNEDRARALAIDNSGRIVVAGEAQGDFALARYNADGSLDATFGTDGKVTTDFGAGDRVHGIAIDSQGRLVAAGTSGFVDSGGFALARYNTDGSLDATFGTDGKVTTYFLGYGYYASGLAMDSNGKLVLAGTASNRHYGFVGDNFALLRYNTDGSLDTTFGSNGKVVTDFRKYDDAGAVAIDSTGMIVVAGSIGPRYSSPQDFALARYLAGETNPPTGSIMIKDGAEATKSRTVILKLGANDDSPGTIRMCISNKPTCTQWAAFAETMNWTLTTGNGMKTVTVWFKDVWGNVNSTPYSDTILLDTVAPTNGAVTAVPGDAQVTLGWTGFADTGSGIGSYKVVFSKGSAPASCSLGKQIYEGPGTTYTHTGLTNGTVYYYRVCAVDNAGNKSTGRTAKAKPLYSH